ncbi:NAD(P)/FAD-dependent oxidoreductase [Limnoglobus roseus]|uniref:FAD-dependent oxidoreductase n=1 Tax=Limnoglobus roseus TaxID=2598579 RepID=A0A5C1ARE3_9BACT|nr:FAD-dependent oxidoreductase [Limnoglobus roseus]QEL19764.1 FAD-dependent oxidoreductase [Limnoglobus roseus]
MSDSNRVVVIGGGVIGAASAYHLAKAGRAVTVVDRAGFGAGCSHANCGYVCPSHVLPLAAPGALWATLKTMFARNSPVKVRPGVVLRDLGWFLNFARRCKRSHMMAAGVAIRGLLVSSRGLYDDLIRDEHLECEWQTKGLLFVFRSHHAMDHYAETDRLLRDEFETPARRLDGAALAALEPALRPGLAGGWRYEGDAHLKPDRLMAEFRRVLTGLGVEIREHCPVAGLIRRGDRAAGVITIGGEIPAADVVFATGACTPQLRAELGCRVPIQPGKGYSITFPRPAGGPVNPMIFEEDRVAVTPFHDNLRVGSTMEFAGYDDRLNRDRLAYLTDTAAAYLKVMPTGPADDEWWGWRPMTPDGLPIIGRTPALANVWLAAGHNMLGLSMAPATGKLIAELVTGTKPHLDPTPYAPTRF